MSVIYEVKMFLPRKAWIPTKISFMTAKGKKPVPVKWVFKSTEEPNGLIRLNLKMQLRDKCKSLELNSHNHYNQSNQTN